MFVCCTSAKIVQAREAATRSCLKSGAKEIGERDESSSKLHLFLDLGFGESKAVVAQVELRVVWTDENVA